MAIKCPSIDFHLTTFKKYQQSFTDSSLLEKVLDGGCSDLESLKGIFSGLWSLEYLGQEGHEVNEITERAIAEPHNFVLKPQKEGGGNNFFDDELKEKLLEAKASIGKETYLSTYLIMERINTPLVKALMMKNGQMRIVNSLSELGIYSFILFDNSTSGQDGLKGEYFHNHEIMGTLMRTKESHHNEGGINAGFAVIDTPFVVPSD